MAYKTMLERIKEKKKSELNRFLKSFTNKDFLAADFGFLLIFLSFYILFSITLGTFFEPVLIVTFLFVGFLVIILNHTR